jgi:hypothetical protein
MRRAIPRLLEDPISDLILLKKLNSGDTIVVSETKQLLSLAIRAPALSLQK